MTPRTAFLRAGRSLQLLATAWLLALALPAAASGDLFSFHASDDEGSYVLSMTGREDPGLVDFIWPGARDRTILSPGPMRVMTFDRDRHRMRLEFENPGDPTLPPTLRIVVDGGEGYLEIGERRIAGQADWTIR